MKALSCPRCLNQPLDQAFGPQGVLIDHCPQCAGVWLDKGEIYYYASDAKAMYAAIAEAYQKPVPSQILCRRCDVQMWEAQFPGGPVIDACRKCGGNWFDRGEIEALNALLMKRLAVEAAQPAVKPQAPRSSTQPPAGPAVPGGFAPASPLPSLALRSAGVLVGLYGVLAGFSVLVSAYLRLPLEAAFPIAALGILFSFVASPFLMDLQLRWLHAFHWVEPSDLPPALRSFIDAQCAERRIPFPSVGIIEDGNANAFTYGHIPSNARLVLTRGVMDRLDASELEAVVAHELGHVVHWDMLIMTVAALVPSLLYAIYRMCMRTRRSSSSRDKNGGGAVLIGLTALALYYLTEAVVLFLSRTRELHADEFAGEATKKPGALASALVKIAYGLAGVEQKDEAHAEPAAARTLGIFDPVAARALVAGTLGKSGLSKEAVVGAMQWDLWNPWAAYYELGSTHPLPARRLERLGKQAEAMGQPPFVRFDAQQPESYWDEFLVDLAYLWAPWLGAALLGFGALSLHRPHPFLDAGAGWAIGNLAKLWFAYGSDYLDMTCAALLKRIKVSAVRGIPARLKGTVIGRGIPGYVVSEDVVMKDETGYLTLDYRQPFALFQWFFAIARVPGLMGQPVTVRGWYRRAPVPYLEIREIAWSDGRSVCYSLEAQYAVSLFVLAFCSAKSLGFF